MFNPQFASDADRITHVLLADGQWHIPFVGTFEIHGSEFTFQELTYPAADSRGERQISGPLSSVLAVRRLVEERAIGGPAVSLDEVDKKLGWEVDGMNDALDATKICTALFSAIGTSMVRAAATTKTQMSDVKGQRPASVPRPGFHIHIDPRTGFFSSTITDHLDALHREIEKIENMPDRVHAQNALKAVRRTIERAEGK